MTLGLNSRNDYLGNGATATYPFTFKIRAAENLRVLRRDTSGAETVLVLNVDYTVSAGPWVTGGSITLTANLASGYRLVLRRVVALTQATDLRNQAGFFAEVHEDTFDESRMIDQQLDDDVYRSVKLPESMVPASFDPTLPLDGLAANKVPIVNVAGTGWTWATVTSTVVATIASLADTALTFLQAGTGAISRTGRAKLREQKTVQDFGALGDGATNDALAFTTAIAAHAGLTVPASTGDYVLASNVTIPFGKTLRMEPGARISVSVGSTLTIHGAIEGPVHQHLFTGAGSVVITRPVTVPVTWFGAVADGSADSAAAFAKTLSAIPLIGGTVLVPVGSFRVNSTALAMTARRGTRVAGLGHGSAVLWGGGAAGPIFKLTSCFHCEVSDLKLGPLSGSFPCADVIIQEQGATEFSVQNSYRRLYIEGIDGSIERGIYLKGDVNDFNNSETSFYDLFIANYTDAAVVVQGANCLDNNFYACLLAGNRVANYGIKAIVGPGGSSGHFNVFGGLIAGHLEADCYIQNVCLQPVILDGFWSEDSERLIQTGGGQGQLGPVIMRGLYWNSNDTAADYQIMLGNPGPHSITDCILGNDYAQNFKVLWNPNATSLPCSFRVTNTLIKGPLTTIPEIFIGRIPTKVEQVYAVTADDANVELHRHSIPNAAVLASRNAADSADMDLIYLTAGDIVTIGDHESNGLLLKGSAQQLIEVDCGIKFPAVAVTSTDLNTLDDYQENDEDEYEPAFLGEGGQSGQVYATRTGWFVKTGKVVHFGGEIQLSTLGTITGNVQIALPIGTTDADNFGVVNVWVGTGMTTNFEAVRGRIGSTGASRFNLYGKKAADTFESTLVQADLSDTTRITFSGFYKAGL